MKRYIITTLIIILLLTIKTADACTSAIISAKANPEGRTLLWKHRDTSHECNFVARVAATEQTYGYVALFNGGDSLLSESWIGMNDVGFAIMNTASYNLAPDTASYKDREGYIMTLALKQCKTLLDFEQLLDTLPRPMGVQANFGTIDASGAGAYYETTDYTYKKYDIAYDSTGVLIRTNFSYSAPEAGGMGFIRYGNAKTLLAPYISSHNITPEILTETLSRSFYHSIRQSNALNDTIRYIPDQDFIPRYSTSASVVIESALPDENPIKSIMWTMIGYPPCSYVLPVTLNNIPTELLPIDNFRSCIQSDRINKLKNTLFKTIGNIRYIDLNIIHNMDSKCRNNSINAYRLGRINRELQQY